MSHALNEEGKGVIIHAQQNMIEYLNNLQVFKLNQNVLFAGNIEWLLDLPIILTRNALGRILSFSQIHSRESVSVFRPNCRTWSTAVQGCQSLRCLLKIVSMSCSFLMSLEEICWLSLKSLNSNQLFWPMRRSTNLMSVPLAPFNPHAQAVLHYPSKQDRDFFNSSGLSTSTDTPHASRRFALRCLPAMCGSRHHCLAFHCLVLSLDAGGMSCALALNVADTCT